MSERVLITGGCGFVGSHLADAYLERGYSVRVLDNLDPTVHESSNKAPTYLSKDVEFIRGDIRDTDTLVASLKDVSIVSHHAAAVSVVQSMSKPSRFAEVNTLGTARLLEHLPIAIVSPYQAHCPVFNVNLRGPISGRRSKLRISDQRNNSNPNLGKSSATAKSANLSPRQKPNR